MTLAEFLAGSLARTGDMLKMTIADFSDADFLVRPTPTANHTAWQIGHLIASESGMVAACGAPKTDLPPGFAARFTKETAKLDDPKAFPTKKELLDLFDKVRNSSATFAKSLTDQDLAKPGPEQMRRMAPTVADLLNMSNHHIMMHLGQLQVIRRKLGKPLLF